MEFSVREWTIIVGVLLIVAVFLDGYRRVRNERSNRIRVTLSKQVFAQPTHAPVETESSVNPELPNGGARIIEKRREELRLQHNVPVLIEPVAVQPIECEPEPVVHEVEASEELIAAAPGIIADDEIVEGQLDAFAHDETAELDITQESKSDFVEMATEDDDHAPVDVLNLFESQDHDTTAALPLKPLRKFFARKDSLVVSEPEPEPESISPQEVMVVNVLSKDAGGFKGPDLLQLLLACDLRFGKKNIFHRYEKANAKGAIQFSVANLVEPGTFDLDAIDEFVTPGVSFFLSLPGPEKPLVAFNYMIETAQVLVRHLNAELRDDAHSVMTAQTIEHCRQRIRDFERKQLTLQL